jgi:hypothetical protein
MVVAARVFYALWSMDPTVTPAQVPAVQADTLVEPLAGPPEHSKYLIVLSKKGSMLRLHLAAGCWKAQTRSFASYEVCDLDPVPGNLYSHYCHTCWPQEAPQCAEAKDEGDDTSDDDSDTSSASEDSEA